MSEYIEYRYMRHNLRHVAGTAAMLAENDLYAELLSFVDEYSQKLLEAAPSGSQYENRMRYEQRHAISTIIMLAENNMFEELRQFLREYSGRSDDTGNGGSFCENKIANAVIEYYYEAAKKKNVHIECKAQLPENVNISGTDLCTVIGNIMENAVCACTAEDKDVSPENRPFIELSLNCTDSELSLTVINSFGGVLKEENGKFLTTKPNGSGLGLESVKAAAEKYDGTAEFYREGQNFVSKAKLKIK